MIYKKLCMNWTYERTECSVSILHGVMTMVPWTPVLQSCPIIGESVSRSDGALSDAIHTVHMRGVQLPNSVPVDTCPIVLQTVCDSHHDLLPLVNHKSITDATQASGDIRRPNTPESRDLDTPHWIFWHHEKGSHPCLWCHRWGPAYSSEWPLWGYGFRSWCVYQSDRSGLSSRPSWANNPGHQAWYTLTTRPYSSSHTWIPSPVHEVYRRVVWRWGLFGPLGEFHLDIQGGKAPVRALVDGLEVHWSVTASTGSLRTWPMSIDCPKSALWPEQSCAPGVANLSGCGVDSRLFSFSGSWLWHPRPPLQKSRRELTRQV